jgi:hypothetical protein
MKFLDRLLRFRESENIHIPNIAKHSSTANSKLIQLHAGNCYSSLGCDFTSTARSASFTLTSQKCLL